MDGSGRHMFFVRTDRMLHVALAFAFTQASFLARRYAVVTSGLFNTGLFTIDINRDLLFGDRLGLTGLQEVDCHSEEHECVRRRFRKFSPAESSSRDRAVYHFAFYCSDGLLVAVCYSGMLWNNVIVWQLIGLSAQAPWAELVYRV